MKPYFIKLVDTLLAILFLFSAYRALNSFTGMDIDLPIIGVLAAIFYITVSFGLLRSIPQVKYLVYANTIITVLFLIGFGVLLITKGRFYYSLLIPLIIFSLTSWYCYYRFKNIEFRSTIKKEIGFFVLMVVILLAVLIAGSYFFGWGEYQTKNLSGPISIRHF
jgi:hypothetical protein